MQRIPDYIDRPLLLRAFAALDAGADHAFADSTKYDAVHNGRRYPPKAVVGLASEFAVGEPFTPYDFTAGVGSKCFRVLESNGFEIVPKEGDSDASASPQSPLDAPPLPFEVGRVYNRRREIHGPYGGQQQGGMSTPAKHPAIFLFTGEGGAEHGYRDEPKPDGTFWYTGEGQSGDMEFVRANRALRDHTADGKRAYLFEALGGGAVRFVGEVSYLGHHYEDRPDTSGETRRAIVFELGIESDQGNDERAPGAMPPGAVLASATPTD